jgi:hypothetical protein
MVGGIGISAFSRIRLKKKRASTPTGIDAL